MKRLLAVLLLLGISVQAWGYRLLYREQLYELYHQHFYMYPERIAENVYWLEQTLEADFANPLNALAVVETDEEWEWYRNLFMMHVNLKLTQLYLQWGAQYMKWNAYFYNAPWQRQNLESLDTAQRFMERARFYWGTAVDYSNVVAPVRFMHLEEIQYWEDEHARIQTGELDYDHIIDRHLQRLEEVRAAFLAMDETTY